MFVSHSEKSDRFSQNGGKLYGPAPACPLAYRQSTRCRKKVHKDILVSTRIDCEQSLISSKTVHLGKRQNKHGSVTVIVTLVASPDAHATSGSRAASPLARLLVGSFISHNFEHLSNRPQVPMVYRLINHLGCW